MKKLNHITYNKLEGKGPTVVFMGGFRSDMTGSKAMFLEEVCKELGQAFVRFDYSGHGKSEREFDNCTIGMWRDDALKVIDELTQGELILIGSSMGGWLMTLATLERKERVKALIGIAAAPDFTEDLIWKELSEKQKDEVVNQGKTVIPNCYDDQAGYPITADLIEEARKHILLNKKIPLTCPVRLLHGMKDEDVPHSYSLKLADLLESQDVEVYLVKNGNHRLSEPENLELLKQTLTAMIK